MEPFSIQTQARAGRTMVSVTGEIDYHTAPRLEHEIARHSGFVTIDLNDTTFIDLIGIKALFDARKRLVEAGGRLYIIAQHDPVRTKFETTAMTDVLNGDFSAE